MEVKHVKAKTIEASIQVKFTLQDSIHIIDNMMLLW